MLWYWLLFQTERLKWRLKIFSEIQKYESGKGIRQLIWTYYKHSRHNQPLKNEATLLLRLSKLKAASTIFNNFSSVKNDYILIYIYENKIAAEELFQNFKRVAEKFWGRAKVSAHWMQHLGSWQDKTLSFKGGVFKFVPSLMKIYLDLFLEKILLFIEDIWNFC